MYNVNNPFTLTGYQQKETYGNIGTGKKSNFLRDSSNKYHIGLPRALLYNIPQKEKMKTSFYFFYNTNRYYYPLLLLLLVIFVATCFNYLYNSNKSKKK